MYKKKSLKFTYNKVSRDLRHAESLKARETSRFKRLSMIRSIDSVLNEKSMESTGENEHPECKKPSRLEMLFKWKQEKETKKEMEKLSKKKPFTVGGNTKALDNKNLQTLKTSLIGQANSTFNSSKLVKNKLETPSATVLSSRIQNSKQGALSSKVPSSRVPNSRQGAPTTAFQSSRIPNSKQTNTLQKSASSLSRSNSTAATGRKLPVSATTVDKTSSLQKSGSSLSRSNSTAALPRKFQVPASTVDKTAPVSKVVSNIQRIPPVKKTPNNVSNSKSKNLLKPVNKGSFESKSLTKHQEEKPVTKTGSSLPKLPSNATAVSKGLPVLNKMPVSNINKNFGSNPKLNKKENSQSKENIPSRKGYCFRTAVTSSSHQQTEKLPKTAIQGTPKKLQEKIAKEEKSSKKDFFEQSLDCMPNVTFNSDISIIKPSRTSFAPANFTFQPPECLGQFVFDDDDDDCNVYEILEEMKIKFMSRTSTPSKNSGKKSMKNSKESLENNDLITDLKEISNTFNSSKNIRISELMTPESFKIKSEDEEADKVIKIQACTENADIAINHVEKVCQESIPISPLKTGVKETDAPENQQQFKESASLSPIKNYVKESNLTINLQNSEEIASGINRDINETESAEKKVDNDLVKKSFSEKQSFDDFNKSENVEENAVDVSQKVLGKKSSLNNSVKNGTSSDAPVKNLFPDYDDEDSLLDSIDLNKLQLIKSDDEDTDDDNVPSPQILKSLEGKACGTISKRVSMLKNLSVMNSIVETTETDECSVNPIKSSTKNVGTTSTPRRSKRISSHHCVNMPNDFHMKSCVDSPSISVTPRRSLRLMKVPAASDNVVGSPLGEKKTNVNPRRSMRLIDLTTPEKDACEKFYGENLDPNACLIDFESPTIPSFSKSKKVSLLYSPEKRRSIRKSIKGDLMAFSPI